jgi:hypothetical protein
VTGSGAGLPATGLVYNPVTGATLSYNDQSVRLDGAPVAGDVFRIAPNIGGSGDGRNAQVLVDQAQTARQAVSGVSLDEEAANRSPTVSAPTASTCSAATASVRRRSRKPRAW